MKLAHHSLACLLLVPAAVVLATGCDSRPRRVPVSGQVLLDGKPLNQGFVRVIPENGRAATGQLDAEGRFTLTTYEKDDGCVMGTHPVEVVCFDTTQPTVYQPLIPEKYSTKATSGLTLEVKEPMEPVEFNLSWAGEQKVKRRAETAGDSDPSKL